MISFFKNFGKGVIYVLVLPILLVGLAIYGVAALFVFIYLAIKGLVLFFTGRSLYEDLPEDKEAKQRIAQSHGAPVPQEMIPEEKEQVEEPIKEDDPINDDPFYVPEYLKTEEHKEELPTPEVPIAEPFEEPKTVDTEPQAEIKEEEIIIQKSSQNSAILDINEQNDDESDDSGVKIDFE